MTTQSAPSPTEQRAPFVRQVVEPPRKQRDIAVYKFEGDVTLRLTLEGDLDTETALDAAETIIKLKRAELQRRNREPAKAPDRSPSGDEEK